MKCNILFEGRHCVDAPLYVVTFTQCDVCPDICRHYACPVHAAALRAGDCFSLESGRYLNVAYIRDLILAPVNHG